MSISLPATRFPSLYFIVLVAAAPGFAAGAAPGLAPAGPGFGGVLTIRPFNSIVFGISNVCAIVSNDIGVMLRVISHVSAIVFKEMGVMLRTIGTEL